MFKIFKTGVKNLILTVFAAAIMTGIGVVNVNIVKSAYCAIDCIGASPLTSCGYDIDIWTYDNKICIVGDVAAQTAVWSTVNPCINNTNTQACQQDKCPFFGYKNGDACNIISASGVTCGTTNVVSGKWNAFEKTCIEYSGGKENQIYGDTSSITTKNGDKKFNLACSGVSNECKDQVQGCVGFSGFCNASGAYTSCPSNNCSGGACPVASSLIISANPLGPITANTATSITFTVTSGGSPVAGATVTLSGVASGTCPTVSGSCSINVNAPAGTITATASKTGSTPGTTTITVQAAGACVFGGKTFAVSFNGSSYNVGDIPKISFTIPSGVDGCVGIYKPSTSLKHIEDSEAGLAVRTNVSTIGGTNIPAFNVPGVWKMTISKDFNKCSSESKCSATVTVTNTTTTGGACSSLGCGADNSLLEESGVPCNCGAAKTDIANPWCCAGKSGGLVFSSKDLCSTTCGGGGGSATISFDKTCYQKTEFTVATVINYTGAIIPAIIEIVPPESGTARCIALSSDGGSVSSSLESLGDWVANLRGGTCSSVGAIQKSSTAITVQSTACGSVPVIPSCTKTCTNPQIPNSNCTACIDPPCSGSNMFESPLSYGYCSIEEIITKGTNWILSLVSSIIVLIMIIGGLMYISSAGDEERLKSAKNIITYAAIGLGIILISAALINEVANILKGI